jgi:hypothetical protein
MPASFADRTAAGGFIAARADLTRGERSLHLLLERRRRNGHFTHLDDYDPENIVGMVGALFDAMDAVAFTRFRGEPELLPEAIHHLLGTAPFTASALVEYRGDAVEFFVALNPLAERPHLWWGPLDASEHTTATIDVCNELQTLIATEFEFRFTGDTFEGVDPDVVTSNV